MDDRQIFAIQRPHPRLMKLYLIRVILTAPAFPLTLPILYFRYHTMRYRFDDEGITMSWGILFRREVRLNYSRIQDIHVTSGIIQRWLGLAELQIQTASGSSGAEMTIEGLLEYAEVRDFLYRRMRGYRDLGAPAAASAPGAAQTPAAAAPAFLAEASSSDETSRLLGEAVSELRGARAALERLAGERSAR